MTANSCFGFLKGRELAGVAREACVLVEKKYAWPGVALQRRPCSVRFLSFEIFGKYQRSYVVVPITDGEELTIWDSKESEFSSGLEYATTSGSSDQVHDLDWSSTPDGQSILAVGFAYRVEILCHQRMTYFDDGPSWGVIKKIEIEK